MYRFVALIWDNRDAAATIESQRLTACLHLPASDLRLVLDSPGMRVFHAPHDKGAYRAYALQGQVGVVLGRLFKQIDDDRHASPDAMLNAAESRSIAESHGRWLVEQYWGNYIGFLSCPPGQSYVIRDPTGGIPCFSTTVSSVDVFASSMEDFVRLGLVDFTINWSHIIAFFMHVRLVTPTTGFNEVRQLNAGECVARDSKGTRRTYYWTPVDAWSAARIGAADQARLVLQRTIRSCVGAWASCYGDVVHELSGGLDSSIVLACIRDVLSPENVLCLNFFTETTEGDERSFARASASRAGCELVEARWSASEQTLESRLDRSLLASPAVLGLVGNSLLLRERFVRERGAGALFSGRGGDHLFQQAKSIHIAADYVHNCGIRPGLARVVGDVSHLTKCSVWYVLATALRHGLQTRSFDPYTVLKLPSIVADGARDALLPEAYRHPWVDGATRMPPCKVRQVFDIVDCQPFAQMPCPYPQLIHPLISQPIIERCLQIPSYILAHGGRERGLVREAFKGHVADTVLRRVSKGGTTGYFNRMVAENLSFLRELLLDGSLVREGIVSRIRLERELSESGVTRGNEVASIIKAVRAEAWMRNWAGVCTSVSA